MKIRPVERELKANRKALLRFHAQQRNPACLTLNYVKNAQRRPQP